MCHGLKSLKKVAKRLLLTGHKWAIHVQAARHGACAKKTLNWCGFAALFVAKSALRKAGGNCHKRTQLLQVPAGFANPGAVMRPSTIYG